MEVTNEQLSDEVAALDQRLADTLSECVNRIDEYYARLSREQHDLILKHEAVAKELQRDFATAQADNQNLRDEIAQIRSESSQAVHEAVLTQLLNRKVIPTRAAYRGEEKGVIAIRPATRADLAEEAAS